MESVHTRKYIILAGKISLIIAAFTLILWQADTQKILHYLKMLHPLVWLAGIVGLIAAQIISGLRSRFYFRNMEVGLSRKFAVALYFTGMFLSLLLPGGISGDAYKIYILNKYASVSHLKSLRVLLSERASGLYMLILLCLLIASFGSFMVIMSYAVPLLLLGAIITTLGYFISAKLLLKEQPIIAFRALPYSFGVQITNIIVAAIILWGLHKGLSFSIQNMADYIVLFLISAIVSVIPVSIGGVGIRELTLFYGASFLGLDQELGVTLAFSYFIISALTALTGAAFWHKLGEIYENSEKKINKT